MMMSQGYLDEVFILRLPDKIMSAFEDLKPSLSVLGLEISNSKCELYCPQSAGSVACEQFQSIPVLSHGFKILGVSFGNFSSIQTTCADFVDSGSLLCNQILHLDNPQSAMLLLRNCHMPRITCLARSIAHSNSTMLPPLMTFR